MKRIIFILSILFFGILTSFNPLPSGNFVLRKVVIDAGHGGHDPGALGSKSKEKDIALSIALKVGQYITENFKDVEVIYTRKTDVFVELHQRTKIANDAKAGLFISIHCNASRSSSPKGTETFILGTHKNEENLAVAKKENASILLEDNYKAKYDGFDPNSSEAYILFSYIQNTHINQSVDLAAKVQEQFRDKINRIDRGVKQAPFVVLWRATMPSILIETGFISNPEEEEFLRSAKGQDKLAMSIYKAFKEYKFKVEGGTPQYKDEKKEISQVEPAGSIGSIDTNSKNYHKEKQELKEETLINPQQEPEIYFCVQFATSSTKKSLKSPEFAALKDVNFYHHNGLFKYTTGREKSFMNAVELQNEVQLIGFKDAFVIAFYNGNRISPKEAMNLLDQKK